MFLLGVVLALACMRQRPAPAPPGGVLAPATDGPGRVDDSKFRVVFSAPSGKAADASELTIVWSRPLRALERDVPTPPIRMNPALAGHFIWVGSRAIRFVPDTTATLPGATRFEVEVPADTRALDGTALGAPHRFAFETPRPALARSEPSGGGQVPSAKVDLYFNLPVEPSELEKNLAGLGLTRSTYRALMLLPLVYVAWADGSVQNVERDLILQFARRRLHMTPETMKVIEGWLEKAPSKEYIETGLQGLLGIALDESMLEPTPTRHVIARMLFNLRNIYARQADHQRLLLTLDRLVDVLPEALEHRRDRGLHIAGEARHLVQRSHAAMDASTALGED